MEYKSMPVAPPPYGFTPRQVPPPQPPAVQLPYSIAQPVALGPESCVLNCPSCHSSISTRTEKEPTTKTHLFALLICLIFFPCACIPYCTDSCQATTHYCPSCGAFLGTYDQ